MFQNQIIDEKLQDKTKGDAPMRSFLECVLNTEKSGKNYKNTYKSEMEKAIKIRKLEKGDC